MDVLYFLTCLFAKEKGGKFKQIKQSLEKGGFHSCKFYRSHSDSCIDKHTKNVLAFLGSSKPLFRAPASRMIFIVALLFWMFTNHRLSTCLPTAKAKHTNKKTLTLMQTTLDTNNQVTEYR